MQPSQVIILVSVLFGLGGLLLGFLLGSAWAMRQARQAGEEESPAPTQEPIIEPPTAIEFPAAEAGQNMPEEETTSAAVEPPVEIAHPDIPEAELAVAEQQAISEPEPAVEEPGLPTEPEVKVAPVPPTVDPAIRAFTRRPIQPKPQPAAPLSIIDQINAIFNQMNAGTPLAERNIRLVQDPTLGVTVRVGDEKYEGIDSVPDEVIRTALKAAVKKWEEG
jgi:hypothetical protein